MWDFQLVFQQKASQLSRRMSYSAQRSHGGKRLICLFGAKGPSRHFQIGDEMPELLDVHARDVFDCNICLSLSSSKSAILILEGVHKSAL